MAGNNIKGITVEINGETGPLDKALKGVNKSSRDLQSELKQVEKGLKLDPTNTILLAQKQKLLAESITNTKEKLGTLKVAEEQAQAKFAQGKISADQYRALQREVINTEGQLKKLETENGKLGQTFQEVEKKTGFFSTLGSKIKSQAENIKTALGTIGIAAAGLLKNTIDKATGAEKSTKQLTNLLQNQGLSSVEAGKAIKQFTSAITEMSDYSGGEAKEALQALTEKGISAGEALKLEGTLANVAAGTGMGLADAANMVADAYHGKAKALVSLGILSKDEVKQLGNSETATISMADVQDRLNKRFGGAAKSDLESYSGQLKENQNTINAAQTQIGTALLPVLAKLATSLAKIIEPIAKFIQQHPKFSAGVLAMVAVIGILVGGLSVLTTILGVFGVTLDIAVLPIIGLVLLAIAALAVVAYEVVTHWTPIKAFFVELWNSIKNTTKVAVDAIVNFFTVIIPGALNSLKTFFSTVWNSIVTTIMTILRPFITAITTVFNSLKGGLTVIFNGIKLYFTGVWNAIKLIFLGPILLILDLCTGNFKKLKTDAMSIFNGLKSAFSQIWNGIKIIFSGAIQAIGGVLKLGWTTISNVAKNALNGLISWLSALPGKLRTIGSNMFTSMRNGISSTIGNIGSTIKNGFNSGISYIKSLPSQALGWGRDIIQGITNGIRSAAGAVGNAVKGVAQDIRSFLHFSVPDQGPLTLAA